MAAESLPNEHSIHPQRRLGRRPATSKPALLMADFLKAEPLPSHPEAADHFTQIHDWGLYTNDRFGVCGPTSVANSRKLVTTYLTGQEQSPSLEDVYDLYRLSGNPNFDPNTGADDNGVIMQDMLAQVVKEGIGGTKALGFAAVNVTNDDEVFAALDIFGFLLYGVWLEEAQQEQTDRRLWDTQPNSTPWGGHAILGGRYRDQAGDEADRWGCVTWGEVVDMTSRFVDQQMDEAWVVIWPEHIENPAFRAGFDLRQFADAYTSITGRAFPVEVPAPAPETADSVQLSLSGQVASRVKRAASRAHMGVDQWAAHHFSSYFKV